MKKILVFILILSISLIAQEVKTQKLIDQPTAAVLQKGEVDFTGTMYEAGGILSVFKVGVLKNVEFGISYGGTGILGRDKPTWNGLPGVNVKWVVLEEDYYGPSVAIGFDSQGYGIWQDEDDGFKYDRYTIKSKGFYAAFSKNFYVAGDFGTIGTHLGVNYNVTEDDHDDDKGVNVYVGLDKSIGPDFTLLMEYDFAFDDNSDEENAPTEGNGFFNVGIRWTFNEAVSIEFDVKDVLQNLTAAERPAREVKLMYVRNF